MAIEKIFPNNPIDIIYSGVSYLQKWWRLLKPVDQEKLIGVVEVVRSWLNGYSLNLVVSSDIVEIQHSLVSVLCFMCKWCSQFVYIEPFIAFS